VRSCLGSASVLLFIEHFYVLGHEENSPYHINRRFSQTIMQNHF